MIQAYYKYRPASIETLALLVYADGKDRFAQQYMAEMLRELLVKPPLAKLEKEPPSLYEIFDTKSKAPSPKKASGFVDKMIRIFSVKGGNK